jgi:hypothetical protein
MRDAIACLLAMMVRADRPIVAHMSLYILLISMLSILIGSSFVLMMNFVWKSLAYSVANFWLVCSARSTDKIGRWLKNSAAHFRSCFCLRLQRFLTQNMTIKFLKGILYLYKFYKNLWKIHTSKKFGPFSAIFRQICRIFGCGFSRPLIFLWGHFFGRLGTLLA